MSFNSPDNKYGVKQRILKELIHVISILSSDITRNLSGSIVANTVALNCLLQSRSIVESLINWMESFYQELRYAGQSSAKNTWLLVFSCVRGYFAELKKVRATAFEVFSHAGDDYMVAGVYLWTTFQSHRVSGEFISQNWREHASIAGIINYHIFSFTVPLSAHKLMQNEISTLKAKDNEHQVDVSRLVTQLTTLQARK